MAIVRKASALGSVGAGWPASISVSQTSAPITPSGLARRRGVASSGLLRGAALGRSVCWRRLASLIETCGRVAGALVGVPLVATIERAVKQRLNEDKTFEQAVGAKGKAVATRVYDGAMSLIGAVKPEAKVRLGNAAIARAYCLTFPQAIPALHII